MTLDELLSLPLEDTVVLSPSDRARRAWRARWLRARTDLACALPAFLTIEEWLRRLWEDLRLLGQLPEEGDLVDANIEALLWETAARRHLGTTQQAAERIAEEMRSAWRLLNAYTPLPEVGSENGCPSAVPGALRVDLRVGEPWWQTVARAVLERLDAAGLRSEAELARRLSACVGRLAPFLPRHLVLTPQFAPWPDVSGLLRRIEALGVCQLHSLEACARDTPQPRTAPRRVAFSSARAERESALAWAAEEAERARQQGLSAPSVIVVVPDLRSTFPAWRRTVALLGIDANFSIGPAVSRYPWAAAGFIAVGAAFDEAPVEELAEALSHARWGWSAEMRRRLADAVQRALSAGRRRWRLIDALEAAGLDARRQAVVAALDDFDGRVRRTRVQWSTCYAAIVAALTEVAPVLDSAVHQLQRALFDAIGQWRALDRWLAPVTHAEAQGELIALTDRAPFQPEAHGQAVLVIGLLEAAGLPHDGLWLTGASADALPEAVRVNRALDSAWQRRASVGLATSAAARARAHALLTHWLHLGPSCVASKVDDEAIGPWSPLLAGWPSVEAVCTESRADPPSAIEWLEDETAPPTPPLERANIRMFEAQAACPRRGYLIGRVGAEPWPLPAEGVSPELHGRLMHALAERYGRAILGQESQTIDWGGIERAVPGWLADCAASFGDELATLATSIRKAELRRIERTFLRFLEDERARTAFVLEAVESRRTVQIGRLDLELKIDRIDRIIPRSDEEGEGERQSRDLVIDYKTGRPSLTGLADDRLTAPQLPVYALAVGDAVAGVGYAILSDDGIRLDGIGEGVRARRGAGSDAGEFAALLARWRAQLEALAAELRAGEAQLAPVQGRDTCERCAVRRACGVDRVLAVRGEFDLGEAST